MNPFQTKKLLDFAEQALFEMNLFQAATIVHGREQFFPVHAPQILAERQHEAARTADHAPNDGSQAVNK